MDRLILISEERRKLSEKRRKTHQVNDKMKLYTWWDDNHYSMSRDWDNYWQSRAYREREAVKLIRTIVKESTSVAVETYKLNSLNKELNLRNYLSLHYDDTQECAGLWLDDELRILKPYSYDWYLRGVAFDDWGDTIAIYDRIDKDGKFIVRKYERDLSRPVDKVPTFYDWVIYEFEDSIDKVGEFAKQLATDDNYPMYGTRKTQVAFIDAWYSDYKELFNSLWDRYNRVVKMYG